MAHLFGAAPARGSGTTSPITFSHTVTAGETVLVVMLKVNGATDRAGGALTWGGFTLTQANTVQKAAASPEASAELWYLEDPPVGTNTLTIPNTGALTVFYQVATGKAGSGKTSAIDQTNGANGTSTNPAPGSVTTTVDGDIGFSVVATGAQTWAPSAQVGTVIQNTDDGATGGGTQYHLQATLGAINLGWTFGTSDDWGAVVAYFKEVDIPPETITADKWQPGSQPVPTRARLATMLIPSLALVQLVAAPATPVYAGGQSCEPISVQTFQYQVKAEPILPPEVAEETVTQDKWGQSTQQPVTKAKRLIQYGVNFAVAEQSDDGLPPVWWMPPSNTPQFPKSSRREKDGAFVPIVEGVFDKWTQETEQPRRVQKLVQDASGAFVVVISTETVTVDKWARETEQPLRVKPRVIASPFTLQLTSFTETASADKWGQPTNQPRFDLERTQRLFPSVVSDYLGIVPGAEVIQPDKWLGVYPNQFLRIKRVVGLDWTEKDLVLRSETVSLDRFQQPQSQPRQDTKREQHLYPAFVVDGQLFIDPDAEISQVDKWAGAYPNQHFRIQRLIPIDWSVNFYPVVNEWVDLAQFWMPRGIQRDVNLYTPWVDGGLSFPIIVTAVVIIKHPTSVSLTLYGQSSVTINDGTTSTTDNSGENSTRIDS